MLSQSPPHTSVIVQAQPRDHELDHATRIVTLVVACPDAEIPDAAKQLVGLDVGTDLASRDSSIEYLSADWDASRRVCLNTRRTSRRRQVADTSRESR